MNIEKKIELHYRSLTFPKQNLSGTHLAYHIFARICVEVSNDAAHQAFVSPSGIIKTIAVNTAPVSKIAEEEAVPHVTSTDALHTAVTVNIPACAKVAIEDFDKRGYVC